jgi:hypothetical protein
MISTSDSRSPLSAVKHAISVYRFMAMLHERLNVEDTAALVMRPASSVTPVLHVHVSTAASHGVAAAGVAAPADVPPQPTAIGAAAVSERPQVPGVRSGVCYAAATASAVAAGGPVQRQQQPVLPQKLGMRAAPACMKPSGGW